MTDDGEMLIEWFRPADTDDTGHLRFQGRSVMAQSWLRLGFSDTGSAGAGHGVTELGLASPLAPFDARKSDSPVGQDESAVRVWRRGITTADDAQVVLSWLHGNVLAGHLGIDTDMLVYLFIEVAVNAVPGSLTRDGEFLATLAGAAEWAGTTSTSEWSLTVGLAAEAVEAVLDAIADSGSRWRYAIVAARDPESPAGRIRRTLLADLGG